MYVDMYDRPTVIRRIESKLIKSQLVILVIR